MTDITQHHDRLADAPTLRLDGKVAWVTGASRGLGRALALALAAAGADVLLTARGADALEETAAAVERSGRDAATLAGSVDDADHVTAAAALARRTWGRLDILVNNAGVSPSFRRSENVPEAEWRQVLDVNLTGAFLCCQAALALMETGGGGSIVNVSSVHGVAGHERLAAYSASKGGMEMLTRSLAVEWAPRRVRVNAVAPGYLETDMTTGLREHERWSAELLGKIPMGRFAQPEEVAGAVLFLAAPCSAYVTGATLAVDGGWTAQ